MSDPSRSSCTPGSATHWYRANSTFRVMSQVLFLSHGYLNRPWLHPPACTTSSSFWSLTCTWDVIHSTASYSVCWSSRFSQVMYETNPAVYAKHVAPSNQPTNMYKVKLHVCCCMGRWWQPEKASARIYWLCYFTQKRMNSKGKRQMLFGLWICCVLP